MHRSNTQSLTRLAQAYQVLEHIGRAVTESAASRESFPKVLLCERLAWFAQHRSVSVDDVSSCVLCRIETSCTSACESAANSKLNPADLNHLLDSHNAAKLVTAAAYSLQILIAD